jgi:hypothetical protein
MPAAPQAGQDEMDQALLEQVTGFFTRGSKAFARLVELMPGANAKWSSMNGDVARKGGEAASMLNGVQADLGFFCQAMSTEPQVLQQLPVEQMNMLAMQWVGEVMKQVIKRMFSMGMNPAAITEQHPRNMERILADVERDLETVAALVAEATELDKADVEDISTDRVDPALASVYETILRIRKTSKHLANATNKIGMEDASDEDGCLASEVQFAVVRVSHGLVRIEQELGLPREYIQNPPKQVNRFLVAWAESRRAAAQSAFSQGVNGDVFLNDGPQLALKQLAALEATLAPYTERVPMSDDDAADAELPAEVSAG